MFTYEKMQTLLKDYDLTHDIFTQHDIVFRQLNPKLYIVEIQNLALLVEMINTQDGVGKISLLTSYEKIQELEYLAKSPRTQPLKIKGGKGIELSVNLNQMDNHHQKAFKRLYRHEHRLFKRAMEAYHREIKREQRRQRLLNETTE